LPSGKTYIFQGATFTQSGGAYTGKVTVPGYGHALIEIA